MNYKPPQFTAAQLAEYSRYLLHCCGGKAADLLAEQSAEVLTPRYGPAYVAVMPPCLARLARCLAGESQALLRASGSPQRDPARCHAEPPGQRP